MLDDEQDVTQKSNKKAHSNRNLEAKKVVSDDMPCPQQISIFFGEATTNCLCVYTDRNVWIHKTKHGGWLNQTQNRNLICETYALCRTGVISSTTCSTCNTQW